WTRGYTTVWSGWENNLGAIDTPTDYTATAELPIATDGGTTITGPAYEYIVTGGANFRLTYPAASGTQGPPNAVLTHRVHLDDTPQVVPTTDWAYTDATNTRIKLTTQANFTNNDIYEFSYIAKNPTVNALGFAAVRDFNSFLRYDTSSANPLVVNGQSDV